MMVPLMLVKSTLVSLLLKMNGEMLTVQIMDMSTVHVHSTTLSVKVLGTVMIFSTSLLTSWNITIPIMMVKLTMVIMSMMNT